MRRFFTTVGICIGILMLSGSSVFAASFSDIEQSYAKQAIETWSKRGVIKGSGSKFYPTDFIIRGDAAVIFDKLMMYSQEDNNTFLDLGERYYTSSVLKLKKETVLLGDGKYIRPNDFITREEAAVLFAKVFKIKPSEGKSVFLDDAKISPWARGFVQAMKEGGYINGYNNRFYPKDNISREEFITILDNMVSEYLIQPKRLDGQLSPKSFLIIASGDIEVKGLQSGVNVIVTPNATGIIKFVNSSVFSIYIMQGVENLKIEMINSVVKKVENKEKSVQIVGEDGSVIDGLYDGKDSSFVPLPGTNEIQPTFPDKTIKFSKDKKDREKHSNTSNKTEGLNNQGQIDKPNELDHSKTQVSEKYIVAVEQLRRDGTLYYSSATNIQLPSKACIALKNTGENNGTESEISWSGEKIEDLKRGVKGEYFLRVAVQEELQINGENYGKVEFVVKVIVK